MTTLLSNIDINSQTFSNGRVLYKGKKDNGEECKELLFGQSRLSVVLPVRCNKLKPSSEGKTSFSVSEETYNQLYAIGVKVFNDTLNSDLHPFLWESQGVYYFKAKVPPYTVAYDINGVPYDTIPTRFTGYITITFDGLYHGLPKRYYVISVNEILVESETEQCTGSKILRTLGISPSEKDWTNEWDF